MLFDLISYSCRSPGLARGAPLPVCEGDLRTGSGSYRSPPSHQLVQNFISVTQTAQGPQPSTREQPPPAPARHCMLLELFYTFTRCFFLLFLGGAAPGSTLSSCCRLSLVAAGRELHTRAMTAEWFMPPAAPQTSHQEGNAFQAPWQPCPPPPPPSPVPGDSSFLPAALQDSHKEALCECICRRGTEAAFSPWEGSKSSAGPGWEDVR